MNTVKQAYAASEVYARNRLGWRYADAFCSYRTHGDGRMVTVKGLSNDLRPSQVKLLVDSEGNIVAKAEGPHYALGYQAFTRA